MTRCVVLWLRILEAAVLRISAALAEPRAAVDWVQHSSLFSILLLHILCSNCMELPGVPEKPSLLPSPGLCLHYSPHSRNCSLFFPSWSFKIHPPQSLSPRRWTRSQNHLLGPFLKDPGIMIGYYRSIFLMESQGMRRQQALQLGSLGRSSAPALTQCVFR